MIYVMSDIHGMYDKYQEMLDKIGLTDSDTLFVIGDVLDRGPQPVEILFDMMMRPNVIPIIGNHEYMAANCLDLLEDDLTPDVIEELEEERWISLFEWMSNNADPTIRELQALDEEEREQVVDYLGEFSAYEEVTVGDRSYLLVHAGLGNFRPDKPLDAYDLFDLVWDRPDWDRRYFDDPNRYVIVGHTPTQTIQDDQPPKIFYRNQFIDIDCGACFPGGRLACLRLDDMQEFYT
ncbi:MAG: metallophosphoesterase [Anaerovoracaceae bacterium]